MPNDFKVIISETGGNRDGNWAVSLITKGGMHSMFSFNLNKPLNNYFMERFMIADNVRCMKCVMYNFHQPSNYCL